METRDVEKKKKELLALLRKEAGVNISQNPPIIPREKGEPPPLSFAQQRLWFLDQLQPGSPAYNIFHGLCLPGPLHLTALAQSLREIMRRHETLRTTFLSHQGIPTSLIQPDPPLPLLFIDLSGLPSTQLEATVEQLVALEAVRPFDLSHGPLLRYTLLRSDSQQHWLLLTVHHIVFDGWSTGIFFRELSALYQAFVQGQPSPLPDLTIQYADYALWQRGWVSGPTCQQQVAYWKQQLAGAPSVVELPTDRPRPAVQSAQGATQKWVLGQQLAEELNALSQREGVSLFMTLLAAFATLLFRYSGQKNLVIGSPIANRTRTEIESHIGLFINMLALYIKLPGNPSFRELLAHVREVTLGAYAHQDLPFEQVIEAVHPTRQLSYASLVQVLFVLQNMPSEVLSLVDLQPRFMNTLEATTRFDLELAIMPQGKNLIAAFTYNTDLFEASTISRMGEHFQRLLESLVANPNQRLTSLALLSDTEIHQQLVEWNSSYHLTSPECIHRLFEKQALQTPDAIALVALGTHLTYDELNMRANHLAHYLQQQGIKPEGRVGICLERSLEMVVALLAVLKAGGAYVPLDPHLPATRLAFQLADAQIKIVLTQQRLVSCVPQQIEQIVILDDQSFDLTQQPGVNPASPVQPENLAYMIYTSGSTGHPKGVQILHQAVVNFLLSMQKQPGLGPQDVLVAVTTISFDIAGLEIFLPLLCGARVVIADQDVVADNAALSLLLATSGATVMQATPATWRLLLIGNWRNQQQIRCWCGGEALPREIARGLLQQAGELWNLYGPTETTIWSTVTPVEDGEGPITIGTPIANTQVYVLDAAMQPVPLGTSGELYIGGSGLARGYWQRPDLTAERFVPNPFSQHSGQRLYRTGDLARYRVNGQLDYLGRTDQQIKIRGFRIEPGEIEMVLRTHEAVQEAAVQMVEDASGDKLLVAYLVWLPDSHGTSEKVRQYLRERLPDYMVPTTLVELTSLPLTPNGKLDRRALPPPERKRDVHTTYVPPRNSIEALIAHIWQDLLHIEKVGIYDNFFELGGHSLLAAQALNTLQKMCSVSVSLVSFFQSSTLAELAHIVERASLPASEEKQTFPSAWRAPSSLLSLQDDSHSLVAIQSEGVKSPFFCIHAASGHIISYYHLARFLQADRPLYGLQSRGFDGSQAPFATIEDMATSYLELLFTIQPGGPYLLGGWSMGATVAFEMAQRLQKQGHHVSLLVSLDGWGPQLKGDALEESASPDDTSLIATFAQDYDLPVALDDLSQLEQKAQLHALLEQAKNVSLLPLDAEVKQIRRMLQVYKNNIRAANEYRAHEGYQGNFVLFRASESVTGHLKDPTKGWKRILLQEVEIQDVPGNHRTMFKFPHIQILAEKLRASFEAYP